MLVPSKAWTASTQQNNNIVRLNTSPFFLGSLEIHQIQLQKSTSTRSYILPQQPFKMHCNSFLFTASSLTAIATAVTVGHKSGPAATFVVPPPPMVTTLDHQTMTTLEHQTIPSSEPGVTTMGYKDLITATVVEIGVYPPQQEWTTIHLTSPNTPTKATLQLSPSSTAVKAEDISKTVNKKQSTMIGKTTKTTKAKVAPTHIAPSTCTTYYPTLLRQISETYPTVMQDDTANTTKAFHVGQSVSFSDGVKFNRIHQHVAFDNIAPGSWDCQLMVSWPDVKHGGLEVKSSSQRGSAATSGVSLQVYSASYNAAAFKSGDKNDPDANGPFSTWVAMMNALKTPGNRQLGPSDGGKGQEKSDTATAAKLTYFGTVPVNPGEFGLTINSQACPASGSDTLQYLFEMPTTEAREASVNFLGTKQEGAGVYLIANC